MPKMQHFTVSQTRKVDVVANSAIDALRIASVAFEYGQMSKEPTLPAGMGPEEIWGNTTSRIKEMALEAERK